MVAFDRVDILKIYQCLVKMITYYFLMLTIFSFLVFSSQHYIWRLVENAAHKHHLRILQLFDNLKTPNYFIKGNQ